MYIREATEKDAAILEHWLQNKEECFLVTNKEEFLTEDYLKWLGADDQHCFSLINEHNQVVGYGEIWVDESEGDLEFAHLIIHPSMRNKGLGKILISQLEEKAKLFPFPVIYMRVNPNNQSALQCYLKCDFIIDPYLNEVFENKWTWLKKSLTSK
ncbi:GNAT family N-acetyltransferase [Neobacillus sp. D3-1R]|uniref:GNAT family N-acetyltransferase n=1 Tax=Neobacillus sp. D3-1R TaxID=3445778 RepID=UPI003FA01DDA